MFSPWRIFLLKLFGARAHPGAAVAASAKIWLPRNLELGRGSAIGPDVDLYNMAPVKIGAGTIVSQRAFLCAGTHDIADERFQLLVRPIDIGDDVWIASDAFVGPGVRIGDGCVLGARGAAFSDLEAWTVYRGNPASPLKRRVLRKVSDSSGRLRITCVLGPFQPVPPVRGGSVERIWQTLCEEFAARGHEVVLISRQFGDFPDRENANGISYLRLKSTDGPKSKVLYRILDLVFSIRVCFALPPSDITITNSVSLPLIIPRRRAGKIYMSVARFPKGQARLYARVDRMQAVSTHVGRAIREQTPSVAELVRVIPNAISDGFASQIDAVHAPRMKEILYVGRLAREKGIEILIRGFAAASLKHPDWTLTLVGPHSPAQGGDGEDYRSKLVALAEASNAPITFVGPVFDEKDLVSRLVRSEIFVYPSIASKGEALPLAPVEAMACGCTVLLSSLDCFNDYFESGANGLAFDQTDESGDDLARAFERLMGDDDLRAKLASGAIKTARRYAKEVVASQFLADFHKLLSRANEE